MQKSPLYAFLLAALCACSKDDERPDPPANDNTTTLEVQVYNALNWSPTQPSGTLAPGATVQLFKTRASFNSNAPAYTQTTDANGKASFAKIDTGTYYIVARLSDASNLLDVVQVDGAYLGLVGDSLYQTPFDVSRGPVNSLAYPGNFWISDLNADGVIDHHDRTLLPAQSARAVSNTTVSTHILIGRQDNRPDPNFADEAAVNAAMQANYASLSKWHEMQVSIDAVYTDDHDCTSLAADWCNLNGYDDALPANNIVNRFWKDGFQLISQLNRVIAYAGKTLAPMPAAARDLAIARARVMKGYVYFNLINYFGNVPRQDSIDLPANANNATSAADMYTYTAGLLTAAVQYLHNDPVISDAACNAILARVYMEQGRFSEARSLANGIISRTSEYQLLSDTADIFSQAGNQEIIWRSSGALETMPLQTIFTRGAFLPEVRLAEMYLIRAESYLATGNLNAATDALGVLMAREHRVPPVYSADPGFAEYLRGEFQTFYKRHMRLEGLRFAALKRWNLQMPVLQQSGFKEYNRNLPIPTEIQNNYPGIHQNVGYN